MPPVEITEVINPSFKPKYDRLFQRIKLDQPVKQNELDYVLDKSLHGKSPDLYLHTPDDDTFVSRLLQINAREILIDRFTDGEARRFLETHSPLVFSLRLDGITYFFESKPLAEGRDQGGRFYLVAKPQSLLKQQRREFYRVNLPLEPPVFFLNNEVRNISGCGLGFVGERQYEIGTTFSQARIKLVLPDDCKFNNGSKEQVVDINTAVIVRAEHSNETRRKSFFGLRFDGITDQERQKVLSYIAILDRRERCEREKQWLQEMKNRFS